MRIDGQIVGEEVKRLFLQRESSAVITAAFESDSARLAAACLIVSDRIAPPLAAALHFMRESLASDLRIDGLTGLLCLEALQLVPAEFLNQPQVHDFVLSVTQGLNPPRLAFVLLQKIKQGRGPENLAEWRDWADEK